MTRVLYVGPFQFPPAFDSLETADYIYRDFHDALQPYVDEILVLTGQPVPNEIAAAFRTMSLFRLVGPSYAVGGMATKVRRNATFLRYGRRLIAEQKIDVVTNVGGEFSLGSLVAAMGKAERIRTVVRASGDEVASAENEGRYRGLGRFRRGVDEWRRNRALARADAVVAMSQPEAVRLRMLGVDANKIKVCPRGVDLDRFAPSPSREPGPVRVLFFGRFHRSKGFDIAEDVARSLATRPETEFSLAGGDKPGDASPGRYLGAVAPQEMPGLLRRTDIAIFPSRHEGLPQGMLEAMASGCACVMSEAVYEALAPRETGIFCQLDASAFTRAVLDLARDPDQRTRLGKAGREFVETNYDRTHLRRAYAEAVLGPAGSSGS